MKYDELKEKARQEAIDYLAGFSNYNYTYSEIAYIELHFEKLGKKYGLLKEFRENGVI